MKELACRLDAYIRKHPFDPGKSDCETVLEQLYQAHAESHESDPAEIDNGFQELEELLTGLPLKDNNAVFNVSVNPTPVLSVFRRCATISVSCLRVSATAWDSQRYGGYEHEQCVTGNEYGPDGG